MRMLTEIERESTFSGNGLPNSLSKKVLKKKLMSSLVFWKKVSMSLSQKKRETWKRMKMMVQQ